MTQDKQPQDILEVEKPATPLTGSSAGKKDADHKPPQPGNPPQADGDGAVQPLAHPPEDTFVGPDTHPRPAKSGS